MGQNNSITLIGNLGAEAKVIETEGSLFAALSVATTDSYKDENDQWQDQETVWHNVITFSPNVITAVKSLKTGTRVKVEGSISYRLFQALVEGRAEPVNKKEASIVANRVELAPLPSKRSEG